MFFFFKQKTAYEMRISDWSSDVCSSDLHPIPGIENHGLAPVFVGSKGRILRTHEMHRKAYHQGVYLVRHPEAVVTSYFRYHLMLGVTPSMKEFLEIGRASCRERVCQYV